MSKTNSPHPNSFLAFACRVVEDRANTIARIPEWSDLRDPMPDDAPCIAVALGYAKQRNEALRRGILKLEEQRLLEAGVPEELLAQPTLQQYLEETVELRRNHWYHLYDILPSMHRKRRATEREWRPKRDTVVSIIVGVHLAAGGRNRAATAKALNRGIPNGGSAYGVTPFEVRNALDTFAEKYISEQSDCDATARLCMLAARALNRIWHEVRSRPEFKRLPHLEIASRIAETGESLILYEEAIAEVTRFTVPDAGIVEIINRQIRILQRYQRRLAA
jgi:hypothetical protein